MPLTTLITVGTVAETSAETTLSDGVMATLVLVGSGLVSIEVKTTGAEYINVGELTTKTPVQKIQGPMTFRVRRALVQPTWAPSGLPEVTEPVGVDLYSGFGTVQAVSPNITRGSGAVDANTQRVTLATDGPGVANLSTIATGVGAPADAAASTDTGSFSLLSFVKRGLQNWTTLLSRIPALVGGTIPTTDSQGGTRAYNWSGGSRTAFTTTSTGVITLPALGASRELRVQASVRCFIRWGDSSVGAATVAEGQMIGLPDVPEVIRVPAGQTSCRVIGETSSGFLSLTPVI